MKRLNPEKMKLALRFVRCVRFYAFGLFGFAVVLSIYFLRFPQNQFLTNSLSYDSKNSASFFASTVEVSPIEINFTDVLSDDWFYEYLLILAEKQVIDPNLETFRPQNYLNRAELVKMVVGVLNVDLISPSSTTFQDVPQDAWYFPYVETAVSLGIVEGYRDADGQSSGLFGPGDTVNRAQAVKVLIEAFNIANEGSAAFPDVEAGSWYAPYVGAAFSRGIISGYEDGSFGPADPVTRAQIAKIIVKTDEAATPPDDGGSSDDKSSNEVDTSIDGETTNSGGGTNNDSTSDGGGSTGENTDGDVTSDNSGSTDDGGATDETTDSEGTNNSGATNGGGSTDGDDATDNAGDSTDTVDENGDSSTRDDDLDGDGYRQTSDCNDSDASISPVSTEICGDAIDQNCDGADLSCNDVDNDKDSYTENAGDCLDSDSTVYPNAPEKCGDGIDQNCSGKDLSCNDVDNDGDGYTENQDDCKDTASDVFPDAAEICGDGIDQNCDGSDVLCITSDIDADGFSENEGDCNDSSASVHPRAYETCNDGIDQDCNGTDILCSENPCDTMDGINEDICGPYYTSDNKYVCACPIIAADSSDPFCQIPDDSSAQFYFTTSYSNDQYTYKKLGKKYIPYHRNFGSVSFDGNAISYDELGTMDNFVETCADSQKENCQYYDWVEAVPSPDSAYLALYNQVMNLLSDNDVNNDDDVTGIDKKARYASLIRCGSSGNPGWKLDHFLQHLTAPLVRWGAELGDFRSLYAMSENMYRYFFSSEPSNVTSGPSGSNPVSALIVQKAEKLGNASYDFADFDVTFSQSGDSANDTYAVFLESVKMSDAIYEYDSNVILARINLMNLSECDLDRCSNSSDRFCCETAVLLEAPVSFWATNPALSKNGEFIGFNRFGASIGMFGDVYDQYSIMKNPFVSRDLLQNCDTSGGQDGFTLPIDCTPLLSQNDGSFDYNACPNYVCCGDVEGVDCSTCASFGKSNYDGVTDSEGNVICNDDSDALRVLNWTVFIQQGISDYLTFLSTTGGSGNSDLDLYKINLSQQQFIPQTPGTLPLTRINVMDYEVSPGVTIFQFIPAPFRR